MRTAPAIAISVWVLAAWTSPALPDDMPTDAEVQAAFKKAKAQAMKLALRCKYEKAAAVSEAFQDKYEVHQWARSLVFLSELYSKHHRKLAELWAAARENPDDDLKELARLLTQPQEYGLTATPEEQRCLYQWAAKSHPPMVDLLDESLPMSVTVKWVGMEEQDSAEVEFLRFIGRLSKELGVPIQDEEGGWSAAMVIRVVTTSQPLALFRNTTFALDATFTTHDGFDRVQFVAEIQGRGATRKVALQDLARSTVDGVITELLMTLTRS